jgi:deoxynucleoside triphosphate triphosphohydrolase SAMHD1
MSNVKPKIIYDPVHGHIDIDSISIKIIDTPEFQRLRYIKQLGNVSYVYPSASHSRFEHSLGVYYLAGKLINTLKNNQPELNITNQDIINVKIAGLCHDLGHGPFSHLFDNYVSKNCGKYSEHEKRSEFILEYIIDKYKIGLTTENVNLIKKMINPDKNDIGFKYQIVSNLRTGLDVDKFDYIKRDTFYLGLNYNCEYLRIINYAKVIDNNICYPTKLISCIYGIYYSRFRLHNEVYLHPVCKSLDLMVMDLLKDNPEFLNKFKISINNPESFCQYTDHIISHLRLGKFNISILKKIETRKLYKFIGEIETKYKIGTKTFILEKKCIKNLLNKNKLFKDILIDEISFEINDELFNNICVYELSDTPAVCTKIKELDRKYDMLTFGKRNIIRFYNKGKIEINITDICDYINKLLVL